MLQLICTVTFAQTVQSTISTEDLSKKMDLQDPVSFSDTVIQADKIAVIDPTQLRQTILGIGNSLEPTTCYNLSQLPKDERDKAIQNLVHPKRGIGMNLMRICMGTPDFTGDPWYSYCDTPDGTADPELTHFSIDRDKDYILPILEQALAENPDLLFFASPWSPPGWMTTTGNNMIGGELKPEYYATYARYFAKFIRAYEAEGIPIHAITIQNEPGVDRSKEDDPKWFYPSCHWTGEQERDFIKGHLGPLFETEKIDTLIWSYDHNYNAKPTPDGDDPGISYPITVLSDPEAAQYVDGVGFHGYAGSPKGMLTFAEQFPDVPYYFTEGSKFGTQGARKIIDLFNNGASSYNAWLTMTDTKGKPNNGPFQASKTSIIRDLATNTVEYRFDFFMYGQFSRYIQRGARRIEVGESALPTVAFKNPDDTIVVIAVNTKEESKTLTLKYDDKYLNYVLSPLAIATLHW